jgi:thioredoxin reductase (NADPH)
MQKKYDVIIIGAGPAGLSAAIYAARYKLNAIVITKDIGGYAATAHRICNYPSYSQVSGMELMQKFLKHVESLRIKIFYEEVIKIEKNSMKKDREFLVSTVSKKYFAKKIIFAGGTAKINLNIPGEKDFLGRGVSYCSTCDGAFFRNKVVAVIGGSDSALTSALLLSDFSSKVYIIYRKEKFHRAEPHWIHLVKEKKNIEIIFNEEVVKIMGDKKVNSVKLKSGKELELDGVFIEAGFIPDIHYISSLKINMDENGYIITTKEQKTNVKGLYAAGDICDSELKQIVTAAAQGAVSAYYVYKELKDEEK